MLLIFYNFLTIEPVTGREILMNALDDLLSTMQHCEISSVATLFSYNAGKKCIGREVVATLRTT